MEVRIRLLSLVLISLSSCLPALTQPSVHRHAAASKGQTPTELRRQAQESFLAKDFTSAITRFEALCSAFRDSLECRDSGLNLATAYYLTSDYGNAARWLEIVEIDTPFRAEALHMHSNSYLYLGKLQAGRLALATLYGVNPNSPQAELLVARTLIRLERESDAEPILQRLAADADAIPMAHYYMGLLQLYRSEFHAAAESFHMEIRLNPTHADAHYKLGDALGRAQDWVGAIPHLQKSLWLNPDQSGPYILLGKAYLQTKNYTNAEPVLRHALRLDPSSEAALFLLGQTLARAGRRQESAAVYEQIRILKRQDPAMNGPPGRPE